MQKHSTLIWLETEIKEMISSTSL